MFYPLEKTDVCFKMCPVCLPRVFIAESVILISGPYTYGLTSCPIKHHFWLYSLAFLCTFFTSFLCFIVKFDLNIFDNTISIHLRNCGGDLFSVD